jgi:hypothetical protein
MRLIDGDADDPPTVVSFGPWDPGGDDLTSDLGHDDICTSVDVARRDVVEVRIGRGS